MRRAAGIDGRNGSDGTSVRLSADQGGVAEACKDGDGLGQQWETAQSDGTVVPGSQVTICDGKPGKDGVQGPAGGTTGFGRTGTVGAGTGGPCTVGDVTLTAAPLYGDGLPAEGQILQISQYPTLFNLIGNTYGGDGESTFAVPDLRDVTPQAKGGHPLIYSICLSGTYPAAQ